jgi:hypothetical protein
MDYEIITPAELKFIKRIEISRNWIGAPLTCEFVLCDRSGESSVTAMFEGVSELEIAKTRGIDCGGPLKVLDIKDRQWENANYKVKDYEEESISFYCKVFSIQ